MACNECLAVGNKIIPSRAVPLLADVLALVEVSVVVFAPADATESAAAAMVAAASTTASWVRRKFVFINTESPGDGATDAMAEERQALGILVNLYASGEDQEALRGQSGNHPRYNVSRQANLFKRLCYETLSPKILIFVPQLMRHGEASRSPTVTRNATYGCPPKYGGSSYIAGIEKCICASPATETRLHDAALSSNRFLH